MSKTDIWHGVSKLENWTFRRCFCSQSTSHKGIWRFSWISGSFKPKFNSYGHSFRVINIHTGVHVPDPGARGFTQVAPHLFLYFSGVFVLHRATYRHTRAQDFFTGPREFPSATSVSHDSGDFNDVVHWQVPVMADVFLLHIHTKNINPYDSVVILQNYFFNRWSFVLLLFSHTWGSANEQMNDQVN